VIYIKVILQRVKLVHVKLLLIITEDIIVQTGLGIHPASYKMGTGSFPGVKRPERGFEHPLHLAPRSKKEWSYTSAPPLGLRDLF
jgi:hypothetical protein